MNDFTLALWAVALSLLSQALVTVWAADSFLRRAMPPGLRRAWIAIAIAAMLFTLYHGYTLELALRTGIYDLRQALLGAAASTLLTLGIYGFRRRPA